MSTMKSDSQTYLILHELSSKPRIANVLRTTLLAALLTLSSVIAFASRGVGRQDPAAVPPQIDFKAPVITVADATSPHVFTVNIKSPQLLSSASTVEMTLSIGAGDQRKTILTSIDNQTFQAQATPLPDRFGETVRLRVQTGPKEYLYSVFDQQVMVGQVRANLSQLTEIDQAASAVTFADGRRISSTVRGLDSVTATSGGRTGRLDLSKVVRIGIAAPSIINSNVNYKIVLRSGDREAAILEGALYVSAGTTKVTELGPKTAIRFPAVIEDVAAGGGGRFLFLKLNRLHKLAVFDVERQAVVKYLSIDSDNYVFGAGMESLLVVLPDRNLIQRYSLKTFNLELSEPGLEEMSANPPAVGYRTFGPAVLQCGRNAVLLGLDTLKPVPYREQNASRLANPGTQYRASSESFVFGSWYDALTPSYIGSLVLEPNIGKHYEQRESGGYVIPIPDGSLLLTGNGIYTTDGQSTDAEKFGKLACLPAYNEAFFLTVEDSEGKGRVSIYAASDRRFLLKLPRFEDMTLPLPVDKPQPHGPQRQWPSKGLTFEKLWHFFPSFSLMVTIPDSRDMLVLRKINLAAALERDQKDYVFVSSIPPATFNKRVPLSYQVETECRRGPVQLHLDESPHEMTMSPNGRLFWKVPKLFKDGETLVTISVKDAVGTTVLHTFKLTQVP